jgi:DNA-directed RNA polymerase specialized sigma24 family protein
MTRNQSNPPDKWTQPSPRAEMLGEVRGLSGPARAKRLAIRHGKSGHIDDEVVVTLALEAWRSGDAAEANSYASALLRRVTEHVRAHVRKNPGWPRLGGGEKTTQDDFCQEVVIDILGDDAHPCHAEVAFGNYVYRRCLDQAGKLYAKKNSAGESLDDDLVEAAGQDRDPADLPAESKSPEQLLIEFQDAWARQEKLEEIRIMLQGDLLPELAKNAFTYRFYGGLKIASKKQGEVTVTSLMGVTEKTATKYINQAIQIIKQRLEQ